MSLSSIPLDWFVISSYRNLIATILCFGIVLSEVELISLLKRRSFFDTITSRKLTHALTGIIFIFAWTLFNDEFNARYYATMVPAAVTAKFIAIGLGWMKDVDTVNMVSRTGDRRELLKGPATYGIVISLATLFWWRSIIALLSIIILCLGDGASGLIGPKYGRNKLLWNKGKSWQGSFAFFFFALSGFIIIHLFAVSQSWIDNNPYQDYKSGVDFITKVVGVVGMATFVESLPIPEWDNVTVFVTCSIISKWMF